MSTARDLNKLELLTGREQQLLAAVRVLLDIPYPASPVGREAFELALRERVFRLLGILDGLEGISAATILRTIEGTAVRPLGYEPAPGEASP